MKRFFDWLAIARDESPAKAMGVTIVLFALVFATIIGLSELAGLLGGSVELSGTILTVVAWVAMIHFFRKYRA